MPTRCTLVREPLPRRTRFHLFCLAVLLVLALPACATDLGTRDARMWEYEEFSVANPSWSGNPFDVVATVTFSHPEETRQTGMFYAGDDTWKFRFTGTRTGEWRFTTSSEDDDLDGHSGRIRVEPRKDRNIKGFLTSAGNKYAVMDADIEDLTGHVFDVYMNQQDFEQQYRHRSRILGAPGREHLIADYWRDTRENGFDTYFFAVFYSWFRMGALGIDDFSSGDDTDLDTPDPALFEVLETAITHAHRRGGRTHIWAWGDNQRKQTPNHLGDGFRGERHKRLIRYIAARLGPLPGWSMNFGFDTIEMPNAEADGAWWADQLNRTMGWPHILTSRGWSDESFGANSYAGFGGQPYELETTDKGPVDYAEILEDMRADPGKPSIYEERHTYNRWRCWMHPVDDPDRLDETGSRRLIWWQTMAGGMGGVFGHFSERFNEAGPFDPDGPCGYHPESLKQAFRTHTRFWQDGRLRLDMQPAGECAAGDAAYCLAGEDRRHFIVFAEDTDAVTVDLSGMPDAQPVVAVDAKAAYQETDMGTLTPGRHTIELDHTSDWALAVGDFSRE